jgi:hypothetical protein
LEKGRKRIPRPPGADRKERPAVPACSTLYSRVPPAVLSWRLEESHPSMRHRTLTQLLGWPGRRPEVKESLRNILRSGWAAEILSERDPGG